MSSSSHVPPATKLIVWFLERESEKFDNRTSNKSIENRPEVDDAFTTLGYDIAKRIEGLNTEGVKERLVTKVNSLPPGKTEELVRVCAKSLEHLADNKLIVSTQYLNAFDTVYNVIREGRKTILRLEKEHSLSCTDRPNAYRGAYKKIKDFLSKSYQSILNG